MFHNVKWTINGNADSQQIAWESTVSYHLSRSPKNEISRQLISSDNLYQSKRKQQLISSVNLRQAITAIKLVSSKTGSFVRRSLSDINYASIISVVLLKINVEILIFGQLNTSKNAQFLRRIVSLRQFFYV